MAEDILGKVAQDLSSINENVFLARELISALKDAGEEVTEQENNLRTLERRKVRWEKMLQERGYAT